MSVYLLEQFATFVSAWKNYRVDQDSNSRYFVLMLSTSVPLITASLFIIILISYQYLIYFMASYSYIFVSHISLK